MRLKLKNYKDALTRARSQLLGQQKGGSPPETMRIWYTLMEIQHGLAGGVGEAQDCKECARVVSMLIDTQNNIDKELLNNGEHWSQSYVE